MTQIKRKIKYRLYPTKNQEILLKEMLEHHRILYNAALQERIGAYKISHKFVGYLNQARQLTDIRKDPDYKKFSCNSQQRTLKRLELAFQSFFRRLKRGEKPGFPRFKSKNRFNSFGFNTHGDGYKLLNNKNQNKVKISGIGEIKLRGKSKYSGTPKDCQIKLENNKWYIFITLNTVSRRNSNSSKYDILATDWGTDKLLTLGKIADISSPENIEYEEIENPKILNNYIKELKDVQSKRDKAKFGTCKRRKLARKFRKLNSKVKNIRLDFQHKLSNEIAKNTNVFITEKLNISGLLALKLKLLGKKGNKGLHRNILDTAPYSLFQKIKYKVEETGNKFLELDTKTLKPSQRCSNCWKVKKKSLEERQHLCENCGYSAGRDINSVNVMLRKYLKSQELALTVKTVGNYN